MPILQKLSISNFRNINSQTLKPGSGINILFGDNGSGKTSVLESIHLLGMARSFRSTQLKPLIQDGFSDCTVFADLDNRVALGVSKATRGAQKIHISGKKADNTAQLAHKLPLQLINADTFRILEGSPKERRHYLDWGVFHVEHAFFEHWRLTQRALQHRNSLLRQEADKSELAPWSSEFVKNANQIDRFRRSYTDNLLPVLREVLEELITLEELSLVYERGWDRNTALEDVLEQGIKRDFRYGYTVAGPQRADLKIKLGTNDAADILSRGQQKILISAMKIAQGIMLNRETGKQCVYLVDDLPAELDVHNRARVCRLFERFQNQVFITCVEQSALFSKWSRPEQSKLFHVKHGKIDEVN